MDNRLYLINLYDYYKELFTEKQQIYFEEYYFDNLSLQEVAENHEVSRNAVFKQVKEVEEKLLLYEDKLKLLEKGNEIRKLLENLTEDNKKRIEELV